MMDNAMADGAHIKCEFHKTLFHICGFTPEGKMELRGTGHRYSYGVFENVIHEGAITREAADYILSEWKEIIHQLHEHDEPGYYNNMPTAIIRNRKYIWHDGKLDIDIKDYESQFERYKNSQRAYKLLTPTSREAHVLQEIQKEKIERNREKQRQITVKAEREKAIIIKQWGITI